MKQTDILNCLNTTTRYDESAGAWICERGFVKAIIFQGFQNGEPVTGIKIVLQIAFDGEMVMHTVSTEAFPGDTTKDRVELTVADMFLNFVCQFDDIKTHEKETYDFLNCRC